MERQSEAFDNLIKINRGNGFVYVEWKTLPYCSPYKDGLDLSWLYSFDISIYLSI